ncbi:hypothetical protein [Legionella drozanskii]|uniref:Uncharacterized protein n=1 Tax=Legionella drozanskii LLAP-1 TaxID=1212489 RepID=A0A0W0TDW8_9GAMM|nr:hypothetical protein [Legionella drozanskii]KTC93793.1 hypothetical protein Ldro_0143 [Legionella drozanskii LLAP-1]
MKGTRVKGPVNGEVLTAKFNGSEAKNLVKKNGIKSLVLLSIIGNDYCDGDYLGATILSATRSTTKAPSKALSKAEAENEDFTVFLVADEVYWHNLKTIELEKEEARLKQLYEDEENLKSSSASQSENTTLDTEASALPQDANNETIYRKLARAAQLEEQAKLKEQALRLGNDYLERNLEQFLRPFKLNAKEFDTQFQLLLNVEPHHANKLTYIRETLGLTSEQIFKLKSVIHQAETPIDQKIALINQLAIEKQMNFKIVRWKDWVNSDPDFVENQQAIMDCYSTIPSLRDSVHATANNFAKRHENSGTYEEWYFRSQGYLTEESPAVMWLGAKHNFNRIIYPGEMLPCFKATRELFIVDSKKPEDRSDELPFEIPTEDAKLLVNWIPCRFSRSYSKQQLAAMSSQSSHDESTDVILSKQLQRNTSPEDPESEANSVSHNNHLFFNSSAKRKINNPGSVDPKFKKIEQPQELHQLIEEAERIHQAGMKSEESHLKPNEKEVVENVLGLLLSLGDNRDTALSILQTAMNVHGKLHPQEGTEKELYETSDNKGRYQT